MSTTNNQKPEEADDEVDNAIAGILSSEFVDSTDILSRGDTTVEIERVYAPNKMKDSRGTPVNKPVIAFKGAKKKFIVGKTNLKLLAILFGPKTGPWKGQKVTLTVRYLDEAFGQKNVPTVRIKVDDESKIPHSVRKHYGRAVPKSRS